MFSWLRNHTGCVRFAMLSETVGGTRCCLTVAKDEGRPTRGFGQEDTGPHALRILQTGQGRR